jgi:hypothetical protein
MLNRLMGAASLYTSAAGLKAAVFQDALYSQYSDYADRVREDIVIDSCEKAQLMASFFVNNEQVEALKNAASGLDYLNIQIEAASDKCFIISGISLVSGNKHGNRPVIPELASILQRCRQLAHQLDDADVDQNNEPKMNVDETNTEIEKLLTEALALCVN